VDLFALFMAMGIECKISSFVHHHRFAGPHPQLFDWVERYFAGSDENPRLPVYLQHAGHSQTIVGIEKRKNQNDRHLLVFDPGVKKERIRATSGNEIRWLDETVRRSTAKIDKPSYEILVITGKVLSREEQLGMKISTKNGISGERFVS
jgi:zinc finger-containing ubiquitin peptidase 1